MLLRSFILFAVAMSFSTMGWAESAESDTPTMEELLLLEEGEESEGEVVYQEEDIDEDFFDDLELDLEEDFE